MLIKLTDVRPPYDHHVNDQVQNEEPKPTGTSKCSAGLEVPEIGRQGGLEISDLSGQKNVLMHSTLNKSLLDSDEILNDQNVTSRCPNKKNMRQALNHMSQKMTKTM
ncbi:hypothetical protein ACE6H2_015142 [Prunus campanulata]